MIRLEEVQAAMSAVDRALFVPEGKISQICWDDDTNCSFTAQSVCRCSSVHWIQCHHLRTAHACTLPALPDGLHKAWKAGRKVAESDCLSKDLMCRFWTLAAVLAISQH